MRHPRLAGAEALDNAGQRLDQLIRPVRDIPSRHKEDRHARPVMPVARAAGILAGAVDSKAKLRRELLARVNLAAMSTNAINQTK